MYLAHGVHLSVPQQCLYVLVCVCVSVNMCACVTQYHG